MRPPCFRDSGKYSRLAMYQGVGSQAARFPVSSFSQLLPKKPKKDLPRELPGVSEDSPLPRIQEQSGLDNVFMFRESTMQTLCL